MYELYKLDEIGRYFIAWQSKTKEECINFFCNALGIEYYEGVVYDRCKFYIREI